MTFANSIMLFGLLSAAVPIIIHLLNRRRHRTVKWAAMQFLLKATKESRGKKRLRHLIILTCRALALAALFFALAQPIVSGLLGWGAGQPETIILVLDRSSSMEARLDGMNESKRERVLQRVAKSIEQLNGPRLVLIDSASGKPEEVPSPEILADLSSTAPTDTSADLPALLQTAVDYLSDQQGSRSEVWVVSDLQLTDWAPDSSRWEGIRESLKALPQSPTLRILSTPEKPALNYGIELLSVRREMGELVLKMRAFRSQNVGSATLQVNYTIGGANTGESIQMDADQLVFEKRLPLDEANKGGWGSVSLQADQAPRDNTAFFTFGSERGTQSFLVSENPESEWSKTLALVAAPPSYNQQSCKSLKPEDAYQIDWSAASLVLWQGPLPQGTIATQMEKFISQGGAVVFFPPTQPNANQFLGNRWDAPQVAQKDQYFVAGSWERSEGPLKDGDDGQAIPVDRLRSIQRTTIQGENVGVFLAQWDDQSPWLWRTTFDQGTAFFVGILPDYTWSNLGDAVVLLPMIQRMILVGNERLGNDFAAVVNRGNALAKPGEGRERLNPTNVNESLAAPEFLAGVYRLGDRIVACNRPSSEDVSTPLHPDALKALLDGVNFTIFDESVKGGDSLAAPFWRPLIIAMLLFLIAEAILCLPKRQESESKPRTR